MINYQPNTFLSLFNFKLSSYYGSQNIDSKYSSWKAKLALGGRVYSGITF